jgi:tetratricopeptide (TPR) repeat protein
MLILAPGHVQASDKLTGTISGRAQDPTGAALDGVTVTLSDETGRPIATAATSSTGAYAFDAVRVGKYELKAERIGFHAAIPANIDLTTEPKAFVVLTLPPLPVPAPNATQAPPGLPPAGTAVGYYQSSSLKADEVAGSVDPGGYSAPANADATNRLLQGIATLLQDSATRLNDKPSDSAGATKEYQRAAELEPSEKNILDWGSDLLLHRTIEPAVDVFRSGIRRYPKSPEMWIGLGIALYLRGNYDDAVQSLVQATDLNPADYRPYIFLANAYSASRKETLAVTERLKRFATLYPDDASAVYYYALSMWKGSPGAEPQERLQQVETLLKKSCALDPGFAEAHLQLGNLYASQQKYLDAIEQYRRAVELDSGLAEAHYKLGQTFARAGQSEQAEHEFEVYERLHQRVRRAN